MFHLNFQCKYRGHFHSTNEKCNFTFIVFLFIFDIINLQKIIVFLYIFLYFRELFQGRFDITREINVNVKFYILRPNQFNMTSTYTDHYISIYNF